MTETPETKTTKPSVSSALLRRHKVDPGECKYCDEMRAANTNYHPSHDASRYCKSGKHNHCTCDTCF